MNETIFIKYIMNYSFYKLILNKRKSKDQLPREEESLRS